MGAPKLPHIPSDVKDRPSYSKEQLQRYFERINLPQELRASPLISDASLAQTTEHGLPFLRALVRGHLSSIPFENLELHYSTHRKITLNPEDLYQKFVERGVKHGRGGRCMENNTFFGVIMRSLGFNVRNCAGRVSRILNPDATIREAYGSTYDNWNHMLNLVEIQSQRWVVDVGMGAMGPAMIYPLEDNWHGTSISPRRIRLQKRSIAENYAREEKDAQQLWCYDTCPKPSQTGEGKWIPAYCFTETEFLPQDYEMMSFFTSSHPSSFFTKNVLCTKLLLDEGGQDIVGDISIYNDGVRKTVNGEHKSVRKMQTETERIKVLEEEFGVELTGEERSSIGAGTRIA